MNREKPIGEAVADASQRGYQIGKGEPYYGYSFKILTRQGPAAPGGNVERATFSLLRRAHGESPAARHPPMLRPEHWCCGCGHW